MIACLYGKFVNINTHGCESLTANKVPTYTQNVLRRRRKSKTKQREQDGWKKTAEVGKVEEREAKKKYFEESKKKTET